MESSGRACCLLLLTMAAVSSGRNAAEYFWQARFQHTPSRPEDALVFYTAAAPPLICELEEGADWVGGDRLKSDLILEMPHASSYYTCSFEGNATTHTNLKLVQKVLPNLFTSRGERKIQYRNTIINCITDSQLPDEYFQLQVQRPNEKRPVKCRTYHQDEKLYVRFPGYPTIICKSFDSYIPYTFTLPGIVGDGIFCAFQVYSDMKTSFENTEKRLYQTLVNSFPNSEDGGPSDVTCSRHETPNGRGHYQVRLPNGSVYDCSFSHT